MTHRTQNSPVRRCLAAGALAILTGTAAGQGLTSETFGSVSGDVPLRGLGLVLELVDADTATPRLRLFGGLPGQPATILLATERAEPPTTGPHGTQMLLGAGAHAVHGRFDALGYFEVPVADASANPTHTAVYAQGVHTGVLELAGGPRVQCSHGLEIRRGSAPAPASLGFDELRPHLPETRELGTPESLAALLQDALDSAGDQLRIALELEVTVGIGIEVVDAHAGGKVAFEVSVTRTEAGRYEVEIARDVAALVGAGAGFGAEVGAEASNGIGGTRNFAFHSAPGAARGVLGMALALQFPALQPERFMAESAAMEAAHARVAELSGVLVALRARSAELEDSLWRVADARLEHAAAAHARARRGLAAAQTALRGATWRQTPARAASVAVHRGRVAASGVALRAARAVREHAEAALNVVREAIEARRTELSLLVDRIARAGRIAAAIAGLRTCATDHYVGWETRSTNAMEVEANLGVPVVDLKGLENSATAEMSRSYRVRREVARDDRPARTTVTAVREATREVVGAVIAGFELSRTRTIEIAQVFERTPDGPRSLGATITFGADVCGLASVGIGLQKERGIGRAWSVSVSDERFFSRDGLAALASPAAMIERAGAIAASLELQDRRQRNLDFAFGIDVTGNGGGIEISAEWLDQGRLLSQSTTVADAVGHVTSGRLQIVDAATGLVTAID